VITDTAITDGVRTDVVITVVVITDVVMTDSDVVITVAAITDVVITRVSSVTLRRTMTRSQPQHEGVIGSIPHGAQAGFGTRPESQTGQN
jgi:hypothetical protein